MTAVLPKLGPFLKPLLRRYWLVSRGMTLGVRCAALDEQDRIILVKHTYVPGWHLPGGGVEIGETIYDAAGKELREEANVILHKPPALFQVYYNGNAYRRDHIALMVARHWHQPTPPTPSAEIAEAGLFDPDELPAETTAATRRRLDEIFGRRDPAAKW